MGVMMIGNIIGPPTAGMIYDLFGNYYIAWLSFAGIAIIGMLSLLIASSVSITVLLLKAKEIERE